jgi:hypothetical protein
MICRICKKETDNPYSDYKGRVLCSEACFKKFYYEPHTQTFAEKLQEQLYRERPQYKRL